MYHQKMLPITLLIWITKHDSKLREKFHKLLESAKEIISEEISLRGALYLQMKKVMKDEFERRSREKKSYSTTSGSGSSATRRQPQQLKDAGRKAAESDDEEPESEDD